jgi:hypothetical protein
VAEDFVKTLSLIFENQWQLDEGRPPPSASGG